VLHLGENNPDHCLNFNIVWDSYLIMLNVAIDYAALISGNLESETDRVMLKDNVEIQV
jgi:hypothetical protein